MRIKLIYAHGEPHSGWTNVCPFGEDGCITASLDKLDEIVCDGEAEIFHALDIIEYYPFDKIQTMLKYWGEKIGKGGRLLVSFNDISLLVQEFNNGMTIQDFSEIIHGKQDRPRFFKRSSISMNQVIEMVDIPIIQKVISGSKVFLEFRK